jgi:outer membrane protein assembly factor BamB
MTTHPRMNVRRWIALLLAAPALSLAADWPHWGGTPARNMVSTTEKNLPETFKLEGLDAEKPVDLSKAENVKWVAKLGSQTYGNPTVAAGRIYVGTNNEPPKDPRFKEDRGILLCLDEATGKPLWQLAVPKLAGGNASDYEGTGVCSSPAVDGDRVYLVTNRCEVVCLDVKGLSDGNAGPYVDEPRYLQTDATGPLDADIVWRYDMRDEHGVFPHNMSSSSVLVVGDRVYATTSNGRDWTNKNIPMPDGPALICLDKKTGKLLGVERSGISRRTFHCNWSSPTLLEVNGQQQVLFAGDDGFCYGFEPAPVDGILKELWRADCNTPEMRKEKYDSTKGPSGIISTPVAHQGKVYVAIGRDPEAGDGDGALVCLDPTKRGDITATGKLFSSPIGRTMSTPAVHDGLIYIPDMAGYLYCLEVATGKQLWKHDTEGKVWGSPLVADGKVYIGNESGVFFTLAASREKTVLGESQVEGSLLSSPVPANGVLYVAADKWLFALVKK